MGQTELPRPTRLADQAEKQLVGIAGVGAV